MLTRRALAPALAVLAMLSLAACTPDPVGATPTPTALSQDEAYAHAEAAFRAYVDAQNLIDTADPATFEPLYALSTGGQNDFDKKLYSSYHAEGISVGGEERILLVEPQVGATTMVDVAMNVCLDVSAVTIHDSSGRSLVQPGRPPIQSLTVRLTTVNDVWKVSEITGRDGDPECLG